MSHALLLWLYFTERAKSPIREDREFILSSDVCQFRSRGSFQAILIKLFTMIFNSKEISCSVYCPSFLFCYLLLRGWRWSRLVICSSVFITDLPINIKWEKGMGLLRIQFGEEENKRSESRKVKWFSEKIGN